MDKIKQIADQADMIINGYAFTREENRIRILNLNNPEKSFGDFGGWNGIGNDNG